MKVALVHDWLTGMRGGERVLEVLCELYPDADLYTLVYVKGQLSEVIEKMKIKTSFLQRVPGIFKSYRSYLPFFPLAIEQFDLKGYDLIISTSHCVAKGILPMPDSLHICYCFTPMRYIWDMYFEYFEGPRVGFRKFFIPALTNYLRIWDVTSSKRVDFFIAISNHVQRRVKKYYGRESTVIYPPVDCNFFQPSKGADKEGDYFLMVTATAPYKRIDIAIEAFNRLGRRLLIIGEGPGMRSLKKMAKTNIDFLGWLSDEKVKGFYQGCRAFIFPGEEDFGMTPVEAQACGRPVIAYGRGGVLESVVPFPQEKVTGVFFDEPTAESLLRAIDLFEKNRDRFDPQEIRKNALPFDESNFREKIRSFVEEKYQAFRASLGSGVSSC
jgi:glycosyltransferase involved in cell wall biosynthesis